MWLFFGVLRVLTVYMVGADRYAPTGASDGGGGSWRRRIGDAPQSGAVRNEAAPQSVPKRESISPIGINGSSPQNLVLGGNKPLPNWLSPISESLCNLRSTHKRAKLASRDDFRGFPKGFALSALAVNDKTGGNGTYRLG